MTDERDKEVVSVKEQQAQLEHIIYLIGLLPQTSGVQKLLTDARICQHLAVPQRDSMIVRSANIADRPGEYSAVTRRVS